MEALKNLHLLRPYGLLALPIILPFLWGLHRFLRQSEPWRKVCDARLLSVLLVSQPGKSQRWLLWNILLAWVLAILALCGPSWSHLQQPVFRTDAARVVVLDLSPSMLAEDIQPNRITRALYKITDYLRLQKEGQTGMVVFSSSAFVVSPLTEDAETIIAMLPELSPNSMPVAGSNITKGLHQAKLLFTNAGIRQGDIIVFSDSKPTASDFNTAKHLLADGFPVSVLSIATARGGPIRTEQGFLQDENGTILMAKDYSAELKKLSQTGGGSFAAFTFDDADIKQISRSSLNGHINQQAHRVNAQNTKAWRDEGHWFILGLLPFVLLIFRRGWLNELVKE